MHRLDINRERSYSSIEGETREDTESLLDTPSAHSPSPWLADIDRQVEGWGHPIEPTDLVAWGEPSIGGEVAFFGRNGEAVTVREMRATPALMRNHMPVGGRCIVCREVHAPLNLAWED